MLSSLSVRPDFSMMMVESERPAMEVQEKIKRKAIPVELVIVRQGKRMKKTPRMPKEWKALSQAQRVELCDLVLRGKETTFAGPSENTMKRLRKLEAAGWVSLRELQVRRSHLRQALNGCAVTPTPQGQTLINQVRDALACDSISQLLQVIRESGTRAGRRAKGDNSAQETFAGSL